MTTMRSKTVRWGSLVGRPAGRMSGESLFLLRTFFVRRLFDRRAVFPEDAADLRGRGPPGEPADEFDELVPSASPDDEAHRIGDDRRGRVLAGVLRGGRTLGMRT